MRGTILVFLMVIMAHPAAGRTTTIHAENLRWLTRFYEVDLGLTVSSREDADGRVVFDVAGDLLIVVAGGVGEPAEDDAQIKIPVPDLMAVRARLRAANIPYWEGVDSLGDTDGVMCSDPEGNSLWFVSASATAPPESVDFVLGDGEVTRACRLGRTGLAVYGGICGAFIGASAAIGFGADDAEKAAIAGLITAYLGSVVGRGYADSTRMSIGRFTTIVLAGNYGIWQGLGWSEATDATRQSKALTGAATGMASLYLASEILESVPISTCQSSVLHATTYWGAWYGFVGANLAGNQFQDSSERVYSSMLWGSTAGLAAGVLWALNFPADSRRVRRINIWGIIGTIAGFALAEGLNVEDLQSYYCYPAIGGAAGIVAASVTPRAGASQDTYEVAAAPSMAPPVSVGPGGSVRFTLLQMGF